MAAGAAISFGWCVKAFFIPLMTGYALKDIQWFLSTDILEELQRPGGYYFFANRFVFFIDVVFASVGYLCALRLIGSQIRSTEPTLLGWVVCIVCYEPFWTPLLRLLTKRAITGMIGLPAIQLLG